MSPREQKILSLRRDLMERRLDWRTFRDTVAQKLGASSPIVQKITEASVHWLADLAKTLNENDWLKFASTGSLDGVGPLKLSAADMRHLRGGWVYSAMLMVTDSDPNS